MATTRAVRIPRLPPDSARVVRQPVRTAAVPRSDSTVLRRPNRAGTQRVMRTTLLFLVVLALLYGAFVLYDRSAPGGTSPGAQGELATFSGIALLIAVVGALLSLGPAPRAVEWTSGSLVVVGRWGRRTEWAPIDEVTVRSVRTYPAGFLSSAPVDSVEVSIRGRRLRSYLVESGLLPERTAGEARP